MAESKRTTGPKPRSIADRFWPKVDRREPTECWPWKACRGPRGYGQIGFGGKRGGYVAAHRASWEIHFGPIPEGLWVLHRCDNPPCVNPAHLFLGTHDDNMRDMVRKGRQGHGQLPIRRGEKNHYAKLTALAVVAIREELRAGISRVELAARYGVAYTTLRDVDQRKTWGHVE